MTDRVIADSLSSLSNEAFQRGRAVEVAHMMRERMSAMTPQEYQNLLRPAFQEDEIILVLVGGVLGAVSGLSMLLFVFS